MIKSQRIFNLTTPYVILDIIDTTQMLIYNEFTFRGLSLLSTTIFVVTFTSILMFRKLNQFLQFQIKKLNSGHKLTQRQLAWKITVFCKEHHRITQMINFTNQTFINKILIVGFLAISQFNIFISALTLLNKLDGFNQQISLSSLVTESICITFLLVMMINCNKSIYSSKKHLFKIQISLEPYLLRKKIQLQRFYESVERKPHWGFSVGPFGTITRFTLFKVCLFASKILTFTRTKPRRQNLTCYFFFVARFSVAITKHPKQ